MDQDQQEFWKKLQETDKDRAHAAFQQLISLAEERNFTALEETSEDLLSVLVHIAKTTHGN